MMINQASTHLLFLKFSNSKGRLNYYQCKDFKIRINNLHGTEVPKYLPLLWMELQSDSANT